MRKSPKDWRLVALGMACAALLCVLALLSPSSQAGTDGVMELVTKDIYSAVQRPDERGLARGLDRARERVRRVSHRDLLARELPGMLRVIDALARTPVSCDTRDRVSFRRGVCHLRRSQFDQALLAFARIPRRQGGAVYRDVAVRLLAEQRLRKRQRRAGSVRP